MLLEKPKQNREEWLAAVRMALTTALLFAAANTAGGVAGPALYVWFAAW